MSRVSRLGLTLGSAIEEYAHLSVGEFDRLEVAVRDDSDVDTLPLILVLLALDRQLERRDPAAGPLDVEWIGRPKAVELIGRFDLPRLLATLALRYGAHAFHWREEDKAAPASRARDRSIEAATVRRIIDLGGRRDPVVVIREFFGALKAALEAASSDSYAPFIASLVHTVLFELCDNVAFHAIPRDAEPPAAAYASARSIDLSKGSPRAAQRLARYQEAFSAEVLGSPNLQRERYAEFCVVDRGVGIFQRQCGALARIDDSHVRHAAIARFESLGVRRDALLGSSVDPDDEMRVVHAQFLKDAPLRINDRPSRGLFDVAEEVTRMRGVMLLASGTARVVVDGTGNESRIDVSSRPARVPGVLVWGLLPVRPDSNRTLPVIETIRTGSIGSPWSAVRIAPLKLDKEAARLPRVSEEDERRVAETVGRHRVSDGLLAIDFQSIQARHNSLDRMLLPLATNEGRGALCAVNVDAPSAALLLTSRAAQVFRQAGIVVPVLDTAGRVAVLGAARGDEVPLAAWFAGDVGEVASFSPDQRSAFEKAHQGWFGRESPFHAVIRQQQLWLSAELNGPEGRFVRPGHLRLRSGLRIDRRVRWRSLWSDDRFLDCLSLWLSWRLSTLGRSWSIDRSAPFADSLDLCIQRRLTLSNVTGNQAGAPFRVSAVAYRSGVRGAPQQVPVVLIDDESDDSSAQPESLVTWHPTAFKIDDPDRPLWNDVVEDLSQPRPRPTRPRPTRPRGSRQPVRRGSSVHRDLRLPRSDQDRFWEVLRKGALAGPGGSGEPHASSRFGARHDFVCVRIQKALEDEQFSRDVRNAMRMFTEAALKLPLWSDVLVLYDDDIAVSELARMLASEIEKHSGHIPMVHTVSELTADPDPLLDTLTIFVDKYAFTGSKLERVADLVIERRGDFAGAFVLIDRMSARDREDAEARLGESGAVLGLPYRLSIPGALPYLNESCPICVERETLRQIATHTAVPQLRLHLRSRIRLLESEGFAFELPGVLLSSVRFEMCRFIDKLSDEPPAQDEPDDAILTETERHLNHSIACRVMGELLALCTPPIAGRPETTSLLYQRVEAHVGWLLDEFGRTSADTSAQVLVSKNRELVASWTVLLAHLASRAGVPSLYTRLGDWMQIFLSLKPTGDELPLLAIGERAWGVQLERAFYDFLAAVAHGNRDPHTAEVIHKQLRDLLEPLVASGRLLNLDDETVRRVELIHRDNEWATMRTFQRFAASTANETKCALNPGEELDIALIDLKARVDHHGGGNESPSRRIRVRDNLTRKFDKLVDLQKLLRSRHAVDWAATQQRLAEDRLRALADLLEASGAFLVGPATPILVSSINGPLVEDASLRMLARAVVQEDSDRRLDFQGLTAKAFPGTSLSAKAAKTLEIRTWRNDVPPPAEGSISKDLQAVLSMPLIVESQGEDFFVGVITVFRLMRTKDGAVVPYSFYLDDIRFLVLFHEDLPHGDWVQWLYYDAGQAKIRQMLHERSLLMARMSNHETLNRLQQLERSVHLAKKRVESDAPAAISLLDQIGRSIISMGEDARRVNGLIAGSLDFPDRPISELVALVSRHVEKVRQDFPGVDLRTDLDASAGRRVVLDPLSIVIREMIDNALKHSPEATRNVHVELSITAKPPNRLRVSVSNPGTFREQTFRPLFAPHLGVADAPEAHWGLSLIRSVCERWDARILDESGKDDVTMTIEWPLVP